jgi:hypothetical protein
MSKETAELLEAFEALPECEKQVFAVEVLGRAAPFDSGPVEDEEIGAAGRALFAVLDQQEDDCGSR